MKYLVYLLLICLPVITYSQEKRIALVIGNANYENVSTLKNPINDAVLMKETFEKLGFDVILKTNIQTHNEFYQIISEYNKSRENYAVGFIYYAGHAVQIDGNNYMLATAENYQSASDVKYKGLNIDIFTDQFHDPTENEVNVLILDACRDNPFEREIYGSTRSAVNNGLGLAEIKKPPMGSLIAFSTAKGMTAKDQIDDSNNSIYCQSLSKNMLLEGVNLRNVFGKVCREVYMETSQYPEVYDKLMDIDFYLKKTNYTDQIIEIDSLIEVNNYSFAREKTSSILALDPNNKQALLRKGRIEYNTIGEKYDAREIKKAIELYPSDPEVYEYMARYYSTIGKYDLAIEEIEKAIKIDSNVAQYFDWRAIFQSENDQLDEALKDYSKAIELDHKNPDRYSNRGVFFQDFKQDYNNALIDFSKAIELEPNNLNYWYSRAILYNNHLENNKKALEDFQRVLQIDPINVDAINWIGLIYLDQGDTNLAIAQYEKGIALEKNAPTSAAFCYSNRGDIYMELGKLDLALEDYSKAIELDQKNPNRYADRGAFFQDVKQDYNNALIDFTKAIELDPNNLDNWYSRGILYFNHLDNNKKALEDFEKVLQIDHSDVDAINWIGVIYLDQGDTNLAIAQYEKGIALEKNAPTSAAFCYRNRGDIYTEQGKLDLALEDYSKAIELDQKNPNRYTERGVFFQDFKQDYNNALIDFTKAIELEPNNLDNWYSRGILYFNYLENNKKALEDFQQILKIDPTFIDAINSIGLIYIDLNDTNLAIAQYDKGIALEKNAPLSAAFCYSNRSDIYAEQGKLSLALEGYTKAIDLDPTNPDRYNTRGHFFQDYQMDYNNALIDFSKAIELGSTNPNYYYDRGVLFYLNLKNEDKALSDLEYALHIDSTFIDGLILLGLINEEEYHLEDALYFFEKGISLSNKDKTYLSDCMIYRGYVYAKQGKFNLASNDFSESVNLDPLESSRYYDRGQFYEIYLNDLTHALNDYSKAIELNPEEASYYFARSRVFSQKSDVKSQMKDLDKSINLDPKTQDYRCERALFLGIHGEFEKAIKEIDETYLIDTTNTDVLLYKSKILIKKGDNEGAVKELDKVILKAPNDPEPYFIKAKLYELQGKNINAANNYSRAKTKLEVGDYYMTDDFGVMLEKSEIHAHMGKFYEKIGEKELMCEEYNEADKVLKNEYRYRYQTLKKEMAEKVKLCE